MKNSSKPRFELKDVKSIKHRGNKINFRKIQNHSGRGIVQELCQGQPQSSEILKTKGYHIIPINPFAEVILGEACPKSLLEVPGTIEIVDIFRSAKDVPPIVDQAIELTKKLGNPTVIWMQLGIVGEKAARRARKAGLTVVMDRCTMVEHKHLSMKGPPTSRTRIS